MPTIDSSLEEKEIQDLIAKRLDTAITQTKSDDPVVHIAWLVQGLDLYHRTNGKRGHSLDNAMRFVISSVTRLMAESLEHERRKAEKIYAELEEEVKYREEVEDWADKLAYAIAPVEVIGEHSNVNNPWENAVNTLKTKSERKE